GALVVCYTTLSPLPPVPKDRWRSSLCGTFPRVTPGGSYPPPCPEEPGRSSAGRSPTRPPDQLIRPPSLVQRPGADEAVHEQRLECSGARPPPSLRRQDLRGRRRTPGRPGRTVRPPAHGGPARGARRVARGQRASRRARGARRVPGPG